MKDLQQSKKENQELDLIESLKNVEANAIRTIATKITVDVRSEVLKKKLPIEDVEELVHDSIIVLIKAIKKGKYQYQGYHPGAYALSVAKYLISNKRRAKKPMNVELKEVNAISEFDTETYISDKERQAIVKKLMLQLGEKCRQLIQLKFFDNLKDKDVIMQQLTSFSTTDSLKSKRSQCMKKLGEIARSAGIQGAF